jgi:glycosyltransferase involved in cell wall biosynthesis
MRIFKGKGEASPVVSVIIPTYNRAAYLQPTLFCLLRQKNTIGVKYEIVVIDSGNDETGLLTASFQKAYPGIVKYKKITTQKNRSLLRNAGAKLAAGKTLVFVDNDMMVPPEFIETHYLAHRDTKNLILLGKRLALMEFTVSQFSYTLLGNSLSMLENMPYYRDVRGELLDDRGVSIEDVECPWRFCWSHNFSIPRELFFAAGGFNVKFGEHWGYEDIELGYRVYRRGGIFKMEKAVRVYHQQHFEQSKTEELAVKHNLNLFLRLHRYYDVELFLAFTQEFDRHIGVVKQIKEDFSSKTPDHTSHDYDMVMGCLTNLNKKRRFGLYMPEYKAGSVKRILIRGAFHRFPKEVRLSLLSEALRVGKTIDIQKPDAPDREECESVVELCGILGYAVQLRDNGTYRRLIKSAKTKNIIFMGTIPDAFSPRDRFLYLLFLYNLHKRGACIVFDDIKSARHLDNEDFLLTDAMRGILTSSMKNNYGSCKARYSISESLMHLDYIKPSENSLIIHDQQYQFLGGVTQNAIRNAKNEHLHFSALERFGIEYFAGRIAQLIQSSGRCDSSAKNRFVYGAFMEDGYLEDGIDNILDAFAYAVSRGLEARLVIKTADNAAIAAKNFPLHNAVSKSNKNYGALFKTTYDLTRLEQKSRVLGLKNKIEIIRKNMTVDEIIALLASLDGFICAARGIRAPCETCAALLIGKKVFVPNHCSLDRHFAGSCRDTLSGISSTPQPFGAAFEVPVFSSNAGFLAYNIASRELGEKLLSEKPAAASPAPYEEYIRELTAGNERLMRQLLSGIKAES